MEDQSGLTEYYDHEFYKYVDAKEADAFAWVFVNTQKLTLFPFKFPEISSNEIRADVLYTGLCHSDSLFGRSRWGKAKYPVACGHEIIGRVVLLGKDVTSFNIGDLVGFGTMRDCCDTCKHCLCNKEVLCQNSKHKFTYGDYWGGYSTQIQQPAKFFFNLPNGIDIARASPLLCAGLTVFNPIKTYIRQGDRAAVLGVGGLGHLAVQYLSKMGFEVFGVTRGTEKKEFVSKLGGTGIVDLTDEVDMKNNEGKFDFLINTMPSSENSEKVFKLAGPGARFIQCGNPDLGETFNIPFGHIIVNEVQYIGSNVGSRKDVNEMLEFSVKNNIYPMVEEFSFEDFPKALNRLENGKPLFRCVVNVEEYSKKLNKK